MSWSESFIALNVIWSIHQWPVHIIIYNTVVKNEYGIIHIGPKGPCMMARRRAQGAYQEP